MSRSIYDEVAAGILDLPSALPHVANLLNAAKAGKTEFPKDENGRPIPPDPKPANSRDPCRTFIGKEWNYQFSEYSMTYVLASR